MPDIVLDVFTEIVSFLPQSSPLRIVCSVSQMKKKKPEAYSGCPTVKWDLDFKPKLFASSSLFSLRYKTFQKETGNEGPASG